jgi:zinc transporter
MPIKNGIIYGYYIEKEKVHRFNDFDNIKTFNNEGFLWLHLDSSEITTREWLKESSGIPNICQEALLAEDTRPRIVNSKEGLLINLRGLNFNQDSDTEDMVFLHMWIEQNRIITIREKKF